MEDLTSDKRNQFDINMLNVRLDKVEANQDAQDKTIHVIVTELQKISTSLSTIKKLIINE